MNSDRRATVIVSLAAAAFAVLLARPTIGGWNDGSRLATVECLVDHGAWSVDQSIFVRGDPARGIPKTCDLLFIAGHYYSDKSPVPALVMAGEYWVVQAVTGLTAQKSPDEFCRWMTIFSSGLAYVVAVACIFQFGSVLKLDRRLRLGVAASFGLCTVAPTYAEQVNNHILLLGAASLITLQLARISSGDLSLCRFTVLGAGLGIGYSIDLGVGPVLCLATGLLLAVQFHRKPSVLVITAVAAFPWIALHHLLNYAIGGTIGPANAVAEYLQWPGSPFTADNMTGGWHHPNVLHFALYALDMLVGRRGILNHNLTLYLALVAGASIWRRSSCFRPQILHATAWSAGAWLLYAASSTNASGVCCSIRWLVPMVAPGYLLVAMALKIRPELRPDFYLLSGSGAIYSLAMLAGGPWREVNPLFNWLVVSGAAASWLVMGWRRRAKQKRTPIIGIARAA